MRARSFWIAALCRGSCSRRLSLGRAGDRRAPGARRGVSEREEVRRGDHRVQERAPARPRTTRRPTTGSRRRTSARQAQEGFWELRETVRLDPKNSTRGRVRQFSIYRGRARGGAQRADAVIAADPKARRPWLVKGQAHDASSARRGARPPTRRRSRWSPTSEAACSCSRTTTAATAIARRRAQLSRPPRRTCRRPRRCSRSRLLLRGPRARRRRRGRLSEGARDRRSRRRSRRRTRSSRTSISRATASTTPRRRSRRASRPPRIRSI